MCEKKCVCVSDKYAELHMKEVGTGEEKRIHGGIKERKKNFYDESNSKVFFLLSHSFSAIVKFVLEAENLMN